MLSKEELGKQIKYYMEEKKMTQKELAEAIQITPSKLSNYITGKNYPPIDTLDAISSKLGITLDILVKGTTPTTPAGIKIENCGDIAKLLFAISDACWYFKVTPTQEQYVWREYDTSTGYPEEYCATRTRCQFSFGSDAKWNNQANALNDVFSEWKEVEDFFTTKRTVSADITKKVYPLWQKEQIEKLSKFSIDDRPDFTELDDDEGELPY